jgi:uncharacterized membrane protein
MAHNPNERRRAASSESPSSASISRSVAGGCAMAERDIDPSNPIEQTSAWAHFHLPLTLTDIRAAQAHVLERFQEKRRERLETEAAREPLTVGQRVADGVAATMGSWRFIIIQSIVLAVWIVLNVAGFIYQWDPYPFILLNLALSFQAAYAAPIIMMSQNRQEARDRMRAELDLETDLKAETLIEEVHLHMLDLRLKRWAELLEIQQRQIDMLSDLVVRAGGMPQQATPSGPTPGADQPSE